MTAHKRHTVIGQNWTESERGWGQKHWGTTLHLSREDRDAYVAAHWAKEKKENKGGGTPEWYVRDEGNPFEVEIDNKTYRKLCKLKEEGQSGMMTHGEVKTKKVLE